MMGALTASDQLKKLLLLVIPPSPAVVKSRAKALARSQKIWSSSYSFHMHAVLEYLPLTFFNKELYVQKVLPIKRLWKCSNDIL